ncbi:unnamed protein product [Fraxinus pennsylvanica]|uniref:Uncharacterized protein n=1 Tax=Fraxinus pennsylvanica TaxID=56036 RepID=A0AAD2E8R1_9LAMI|nr:unnamed protein product [Fraxinus pennsylvanica]
MELSNLFLSLFLIACSSLLLDIYVCKVRLIIVIVIIFMASISSTLPLFPENLLDDSPMAASSLITLSIFGTQVSSSLRMDEIGREKAALCDELCLWRESCVKFHA